jgi:GT2 family glycosyltransferase
VVVDNASDERTRELLAVEAARRDGSFHSIRLEENTGGAGGFHAGMRACLSLPCTHMWLMDDDCEPDSEAVAELVVAAAIVGEDAVLGGNIVDLNGESVNSNRSVSGWERTVRRSILFIWRTACLKCAVLYYVRFIPRFR